MTYPTVLVICMSNSDCIDISSTYSSMIYSNKSIISINLYILIIDKTVLAQKQ